MLESLYVSTDFTQIVQTFYILVLDLELTPAYIVSTLIILRVMNMLNIEVFSPLVVANAAMRKRYSEV